MSPGTRVSGRCPERESRWPVTVTTGNVTLQRLGLNFYSPNLTEANRWVEPHSWYKLVHLVKRETHPKVEKPSWCWRPRWCSVRQNQQAVKAPLKGPEALVAFFTASSACEQSYGWGETHCQMEQSYSVLTVCRGVFLLLNDCTCSERKKERGKKGRRWLHRVQREIRNMLVTFGIMVNLCEWRLTVNHTTCARCTGEVHLLSSSLCGFDPPFVSVVAGRLLNS